MVRAEKATPLLQPGQILGGCRIVQNIGRGGMGEVYLAEHLRLEIMVAVKTLASDWGGPDTIDRFLKEARIGARIEHPNVITIHDVDERDGIHFIVMQYIEGTDLAALLEKERGPLRWHTAVKLIRGAAKGLHAVHQQGLVHRDIKPANIMLANDGRVLLMDFGLVRDIERSELTLTQTGTVMGTVPFMSPEQCRGDKVDRRSDIFSLGSTLYCLLTGKYPFAGDMNEVFFQIASGKRPQPVSTVNPSVPVAVSDVLAKAMAPKAADRFDDAQQLANALGKVAIDKIRPQLAKTEPLPAKDTRPDHGPVAEMEILDEIVADEGDASPLANPNLWIVGGSVIAAVLLLAIVVNIPNMKTTTGPTGEGMVFVSAGNVQLGNTESHVRRYLTSEFKEQAGMLDQLVEFVGQEPQRQERVAGFWIDQYEVTNAEYAKFVRATGRRAPKHFVGLKPPAGKEDHPVVNVTYEDATAYAEWAKKKLPTREQWLRAFRADSSDLFPWGNQYTDDGINVSTNANFPSTSAVTATPNDKSGFEVYNLVGNASEFIRGHSDYGGVSVHFTKGASWSSLGCVYGVASASLRIQDGIGWGNDDTGFRCVVEQ